MTSIGKGLGWVLGTLLTTSTLVAQEVDRPSLRYHLNTGMLFETNLEREETPTGAYGGVVGLGIGFRNRARRPSLEFGYEIAGHRYSVPARWNRLSHAGTGAVTVYPTRRLAMRLEAEATIKGSSEDRDLGNQYRLRQTIEWRILRDTEIEIGAVARLRRYSDNLDRNATNTYAEVKLTQRIIQGLDLAASGRLESNDASGTRYQYDRVTYQIGLEATGGFGEFDIEGGYKIQDYRTRLVDGGAADRSRRQDRRYQVEASWTIFPWETFGIAAGYQFEHRVSNDPNEGYVAHQFGLWFTRRW